MRFLVSNNKQAFLNLGRARRNKTQTCCLRMDLQCRVLKVLCTVSWHTAGVADILCAELFLF